jgi:hypothetical protein
MSEYILYKAGIVPLPGALRKNQPQWPSGDTSV